MQRALVQHIPQRPHTSAFPPHWASASLELWIWISLLFLLLWHSTGRCSVRQGRLIWSHSLRLYQCIMVGLRHQELGVDGHFAFRKKQRDVCWCSTCLLLFILPGIPAHGTVPPHCEWVSEMINVTKFLGWNIKALENMAKVVNIF